MGRGGAVAAAAALLWALPACAQDYRVPVDSVYPFIDYKADTLCWAGDSSRLYAFYEKLDGVMRTKTGHVSIVHIGGSHVQAGTMSHRIRSRLLAAADMPAASRGMIFPYSTADKCNNPADYGIRRSSPFHLIRNVYPTHDFPLGVTGIATWCADTLHSFAVVSKDSLLPFESDTIVLMGDTRGWPVEPVLKEDTTWHFPDSVDLRNGLYYYYRFDRKVKDFSVYLPCSRGDTFIVNGILLKNVRQGITFHSIGVNGAAVDSYLRCRNFERDLTLISPDLVIFGIGVNDAFAPGFDTVEFKNSYLRLISQIRAVRPDCAFIYLTNNDTYRRVRRGRYAVNGNGPAVCDVMYRLCRLTGGAVWDQFAIMGGLRSMEQWREAGLGKRDRIHFTNEGYRLLGDLFYNAFIRELQKR